MKERIFTTKEQGRVLVEAGLPISTAIGFRDKYLDQGDYISLYTKSVKQYTFVRNIILGITNTLYRLLKSEIAGFFY